MFPRPRRSLVTLLWALCALVAGSYAADPICTTDKDCSGTEVCLFGLCYVAQAAAPGTDLVKCEDVCVGNGRCVDNVCVLDDGLGENGVVQNSTDTTDTTGTNVSPSPPLTSGSSGVPQFGVFLSGLVILVVVGA